jgi:hypothetical protein
MLIDEHLSGCQNGPVKADCPVECLRGVLSASAFIPLSRAFMASFEPPRTVGEVAQLHQRGNCPRSAAWGHAGSVKSSCA